MSISKTKAIWFGQGHANTYQLCPDLTLDWASEFGLLGIDFTNNLVGMECNFGKIEEIKSFNFVNSWMHRTKSVYGKVLVIKTLALSKTQPSSISFA